MMRTALLTVSVLTLIGSVGTQVLHAQPQGVKRTALMQKDLSGIDGREAVMFLAEIAPGAQSGRHYHPGTEIAYVLSGTGVMEVDGRGPSDLREGVHAVNDPKTIHNAKNTGSTPLKILVIMVHPKGEPGVVPVQ
jgi:quercetin dioxygenase-like cupin family protein